MKKASVLKVAQSGFTLIELVMVIVILGILSAIALPRFVDLGGQASLAAAQGVAGAISSGSAANFAAKKAGSASAVAVSSATTCSTTVLGPILQGGTWPTGYTVAGTGDCSVATTDAVNCTVTSPSNAQTATAQVYCAR